MTLSPKGQTSRLWTALSRALAEPVTTPDAVLTTL